MCRPAQCRVCGKTTWQGCGAHIEEVRAQVPPEQWCPGHPGVEPSGAGNGSRFLRRLLTAHRR